MMHNLFAISLILLITASIVIAKLTWVRPSKKKGIISVLVGFIGLVVTIGQIPVHGCHAGGTIAPPIFTALSLFIICAFSRLHKSKYVVLLFFLITGSAVVHWSVDIVHSANCTGNRNHAERLNKTYLHQNEGIINALKNHLDSEEWRNVEFPEGWLETVLLDTMNEPFFKKKGAYTIPEYTVNQHWHSWYSGIYQLEKIDLGIWSHGGKYLKLIDNLEMKPRTEPEHRPYRENASR